MRRRDVVDHACGPGLRRLAAIVVCALSLCGCSAPYVLRAGYEEAKILWRRQPIAELLADPNLDAATRAKLELVLEVRRYARDALGLRVGGSYSSLSRVDADQVVHVVAAAPPFRLEPYTWWFPIVGRVPYKGFFSKADAVAEAAALRRDGFDTAVRPSVAFSTLGWFDDPLLSTVLRYDRVSLADTVLHELLHNTVYLPGHARFDESFATFVGHRGAIAFFTQRGEEAGAARAAAAWHDAVVFSDFLGRFTARLREAYARGITLAQRQELFAAAQEELGTLGLRARADRGFGAEPLNNALILHALAYADRLGVFEAVFRREGEDLRRTVTAVLEAAQGASDDPFAALAEAFAPTPAGAASAG